MPISSGTACLIAKSASGLASSGYVGRFSFVSIIAGLFFGVNMPFTKIFMRRQRPQSIKGRKHSKSGNVAGFYNVASKHRQERPPIPKAAMLPVF